MNPAAQSALFDLTLTHLMCGSRSEALIISRGLHAADPQEPASLALLCVCLLADNQLAEGEAVFRRFENHVQDQDDALAVGGLVLAAALHLAAGRPEEGAAQLRQYLGAARIC